MQILNFGSLNFDRTYSVQDFVQAGETISSINYAEFLGGKGLNQSIALSQAGCSVYHIGAVGVDGKKLINLLQNYQVNTDFIFTSPTQTGHAIIQIASSGDNAIIIDGGANQTLTTNQIDQVFDYFTTQHCAVLLQNEISNVDYIIEKAAARGYPIYINPSPLTQELKKAPLDKAEIFILNEREAFGLTQEQDQYMSLQKLKALYPHSRFVLTLGSKGAIYFDGNNLIEQAAYQTQVVDTTCAGDTFTGYFIGGVIQEKSIPESLHQATVAASLCIENKGAANSIPSMSAVKNRQKTF